MDLATATTPDAPPARREWAWAAAALAVPVLWLYGRVLFFDAALHARDILHHYWPQREAITRAVSAGELPLWSSALSAGMPLLANIHSATLYPPNVLYFVLDFPRAYAWLVAFHALVLGLGCWALFRRRVGFAPALAGALVVQVSGPLVSLHPFGHLLAALAWLPWVLWAMELPLPTARRAVATAAPLVLQLLAGDPLAALFSAIAAAAFLATQPARRDLARALALAAAVALLVSMAQLLPAAELLTQTARASGGNPTAWSLHPARALEFLLPDPFGHYLEPPPFWARLLSNGPVRVPFLLSAYLGAGALGFAALGAVARLRQAAPWLLVAGLGLVLALGDRLVAGPLLAHVPPFSFFRYPEKYLCLATVALGGLASLGVAALPGASARARLVAAAPAALVLTLAGLASAPVGFLLDLARRAAATTGGAVAPEEVLGALQEAALAAAPFSAVLLLLAAVAGRLRGRVAAALAVAVLALDGLGAAQRHVWTAPLALFRERPAIVDALRAGAASRPTPFRLWRDNQRMEFRAQLEAGYEGMVNRRSFDVATLKSALGTLWGLEEATGATAVQLRRWDQLVQQSARHPAGLLRLFNVCYAIALQGPETAALPDLFTLLQPLPNGAGLFRVEGCLPRAFAPAQVARAEDARAAFEALAGPGFDVTRDAVIEAEAPPQPAGVQVEVLGHGDGWYRVRWAAPAPATIVVSEAWFPGWRAEARGLALPLAPADGALLGVLVPAGQGEATLRYHPRMLAPGVVLSVLGVLLAMLLLRQRPLTRPVTSGPAQ